MGEKRNHRQLSSPNERLYLLLILAIEFYNKKMSTDEHGMLIELKCALELDHLPKKNECMKWMKKIEISQYKPIVLFIFDEKVDTSCCYDINPNKPIYVYDIFLAIWDIDPLRIQIVPEKTPFPEQVYNVLHRQGMKREDCLWINIYTK